MAGVWSVEPYGDPLRAVRGLLDGADEALLGVAFVQQRGINLLEPQLRTAGAVRLVTTTAFGSTTIDGLARAHALGVGVRVLNPARGTFHPKLYVARRDDELAAVVGSANLTSGLVANVEAGVVLRGPRDAPALRQLWEVAELWWAHRDGVAWTAAAAPAPREVLAEDLLVRLRGVIGPDVTEVSTLGPRPKPNWVHEVTPDGVWVETLESRRKGARRELVEAWMIQIAWDWLSAHGRLRAAFLQDNDGLNVKRSSFVCALLARLPEVEVLPGRWIELGLVGWAA